MKKEIIPPSVGFRPEINLQGINIGAEPPKNNVDLEKPPIDIPPVDIKPPEVELHNKVVLPSLDSVINANDPNVEIKAPQILDIPDASISANINLPKKIIEEPEASFEPPKIDFDTNISAQPPLINTLISGLPETPIIVGSKAEKPDISKLRKKSSNKDVIAEGSSINVEGPKIDVGGKLAGALDALGPLDAKAKLNVGLGKGKINAEAKVEKKGGEKKEDKKEEPKEKPIQMKSFISQDVNAPIHPVRQIPKIRIFKGFHFGKKSKKKK